MAVVDVEDDDVAGVGGVPVDVPGDGGGGQGVEGGAVEPDDLLERVGRPQSCKEGTPGQSRDCDEDSLHRSEEVRSLRADLAPVAPPGLPADLVQRHAVGAGPSRGDREARDGEHLRTLNHSVSLARLRQSTFYLRVRGHAGHDAEELLTILIPLDGVESCSLQVVQTKQLELFLTKSFLTFPIFKSFVKPWPNHQSKMVFES